MKKIFFIGLVSLFLSGAVFADDMLTIQAQDQMAVEQQILANLQAQLSSYTALPFLSDPSLSTVLALLNQIQILQTSINQLQTQISH